MMKSSLKHQLRMPRGGYSHRIRLISHYSHKTKTEKARRGQVYVEHTRRYVVYSGTEQKGTERREQEEQQMIHTELRASVQLAS